MVTSSVSQRYYKPMRVTITPTLTVLFVPNQAPQIKRLMPNLNRISPTFIPRSIALTAIENGLAEAAAEGIPFTATVVDAGGHLVAVVREDGAAIASIETIAAKARTSVYFAQATTDLQGACSPGRHSSRLLPPLPPSRWRS